MIIRMVSAPITLAPEDERFIWFLVRGSILPLDASWEGLCQQLFFFFFYFIADITFIHSLPVDLLMNSRATSLIL